MIIYNVKVNSTEGIEFPVMFYVIAKPGNYLSVLDKADTPERLQEFIEWNSTFDWVCLPEEAGRRFEQGRYYYDDEVAITYPEYMEYENQNDPDAILSADIRNKAEAFVEALIEVNKKHAYDIIDLKNRL